MSHQELYVIKHPDDYYKIGVSKHPRKRVKKHQRACPKQLVLWLRLNCIAGAQGIETRIHKRFSDRHVRNEWFEIPDETELRDALEAEAQDPESYALGVREVGHAPERSIPNSVVDS